MLIASISLLSFPFLNQSARLSLTQQGHSGQIGNARHIGTWKKQNPGNNGLREYWRFSKPEYLLIAQPLRSINRTMANVFFTKVENSPIDIWPMKMTKAIMMMVMWQWRYWWWWWQWRWNSPVDIWLSPWMSMSTSNQTRDDSIATRFLAIAPLFGLPLFFSFSAFFRISLFQDLAPTAFFNVSSSKLVAASCFIGHRLPNVQATKSWSSQSSSPD